MWGIAVLVGIVLAVLGVCDMCSELGAGDRDGEEHGES